MSLVIPPLCFVLAATAMITPLLQFTVSRIFVNQTLHNRRSNDDVGPMNVIITFFYLFTVYNSVALYSPILNTHSWATARSSGIVSRGKFNDTFSFLSC